MAGVCIAANIKILGHVTTTKFLLLQLNIIKIQQSKQTRQDLK